MLRLEVDREADPITGTLAEPGAIGVPFTGWLGLTNAIETIRGTRDDVAHAPLLVRDPENLAD